MPRPNVLRVTTSGGLDVALRALDDDERAASPCELCAIRRAELEVRVLNDAGTDVLEPLRICGDELAAGLAVRLGRAHVDAGGALDDLRRGPDAA